MDSNIVHSSPAGVRRIIRNLGHQQKEIQRVLMVVRGDHKRLGLIHASEKMQEVINNLLVAA